MLRGTEQYKILHEKAEELLKQNDFNIPENYVDEFQHVLEELRIHEIELEMQHDELEKTHVSLADQKTIYQDLFDFAPLAYIIMNENGNIINLNIAAAEMLAISIEKIRHTSIFPFLDDKSKIIFHHHFKIASESDNVVTGELTLINNDNQRIFTIIHTRAFFSRELNKKLFRTSFTDISQIINQNKYIQQSEQKFKSIFNNSPVGILIYDNIGRLIDANNKALEILGIDNISYILGISIYDYINFSFDKINKLQIGETINYYAPLNFDFIKNQRLFQSNNVGIKYFNWTISKNDSKGFIVQIDDISEKIQAEINLRESETKYRTLFNKMLNGFALHEIILDEFENPVDYKFLEINIAFENLTGLKREDIIGKTVKSILPQTENYWIENYGRVALTGETLRTVNFSEEFNKYFEVIAYSPRYKLFAVIFSDKSDEIKSLKLLQQSKARYFQTIESSPIPFLELNENGQYIYVNQSAVDTLGYSREEFYEKYVWDIVIEQTEVTKKTFSEFRANKKDLNEYKIRCKDNSIKQFLINSAVLDNGRNIAFLMDVTASRESEILLKSSEEKYRRLFDSANDTILLADLETGIIFDANDECENLFGYKKNEIIGMHQKQLHPKSHDTGSFSKTFNDHRSIDKSSTLRTEIITKDGTIRQVSIKASKVIINDKLSMLGIFRDITEEYNYLKRISENEQRIRSLVNSIDAIVFTLDKNYKHTSIFGKGFDDGTYSKDFFIGKDALEILGEEAGAIHIKSAFRALNGESLIYSWSTHSENPKYFETYLSPMYDNGEIYGVVGVGLDVTERYLLNEELIKSTAKLEKINSEKDKLFSIIAHDLRNPIHGINSILGELLENNDKLSHTEKMSLLSGMKAASENTADLLESLFTWSRSQSGRLELEPEKLNLARMVKISVDNHKAMSSTKNIILKVNIDSSQYIIADKKLILVILNNLISNAVKFSFRNSHIDIFSKVYEDYVHLIIKDYGIGMSQETLNKLFVSDNVKINFGTEGEKGTGFGLTTIKEFIELNNSKIYVKSEEQKGSEFTVTFKIAK